MLEVILDGTEIADRKQLHDRLAAKLKFPPWYGRNLDALHDCLADIHVDTSLTVLHFGRLQENLGPYAEGLLMVLRQAEKENPRFHLTEIRG